MRALVPLMLVAATLASACAAEPESPPIEQTAPAPARTLELDPPLDFTLAPYTGWTRAHYEAVFGRMLLGFVAHRSDDGARTRYVGGEKLPAAMEGAMRMLPALEAWLACPCNPERVRVGEQEIDVTALALDIVRNGTDPRSRDYWHPIGKGWDQRKVEAAALASILVHARARVWDRLSVFEQARVMTWLRATNELLAANWVSFQLARDSARVALGWPVGGDQLARELELIESDYEGDGFYRDGGPHRFDWYNAFVIHPQLIRWRTAVAADDPSVREQAERIAARTRTFLGELPYLMDRSGAVVPIGRSLGYRSAVLGALQASVVAGDEFVAPGLARRMCSGSLRLHVDAGMFGPDSVLTRGYHGEQPNVVENYQRPGSQYFATHGLAVLALAPDHPFWSAPEQPLPADLGDFEHAIPAIGWMLEHDQAGGGLVLHNVRSAAGKREFHERYRKLAYPALTWFAHASEGRHPYDASVISATEGRFDRPRHVASAWGVAPGFAWTRYALTPDRDPPLLGEAPPHVIATAVLTPRRDDRRPESSVRLSCVWPSLVEPARVLEGSLALAGPVAVSHGAARAGISDAHAGPWWSVASSGAPHGGGAVLLAGLHGWTQAEPRLDWTSPSPHVLGGEATWIGLGTDALATSGRCYASLQHVERAPFEPEPVLAAAPRVSFAGTQAQLEWPDDAHAWVELGSDPRERVLEIAGLRLTGPLRMAMVDTREDAVRVVAVGLRSLSDARGPLLSAHAPRTITCELDTSRWRCEVDGPLLASAHAPGMTITWEQPLWLGQAQADSHTLTPRDDGWVVIEPPASTTSTMLFELQ